jgi:RNase H-fold protein (predicted Holliday junction resolvase)
MSQLGERIVLAIDPGSSKCGLALVKRFPGGKIDLLWRKIVPTDTVCDELKEAQSIATYSMLIVGSGTTSKPLVSRLRDEMPGVGILVVDEKDTSMQARERYWVHRPRRGWRRLLPATMQVPPEPIDDFAALILAERVLNE